MDMLIDTQAGDYTGTHTKTLENTVYLRLTTLLGSYCADPNIGSRLHELAREKDVPRVRLLAKQHAEQALQRLITDGRAESVTFEALHPTSGWLVLLIDVVDAHQNKTQYQHNVRIA